MDIIIRIGTDNAAFSGNPMPEVARILRGLIKELLEDGPRAIRGGRRLRDINGNTVGLADIDE